MFPEEFAARRLVRNDRGWSAKYTESEEKSGIVSRMAQVTLTSLEYIPYHSLAKVLNDNTLQMIQNAFFIISILTTALYSYKLITSGINLLVNIA